MSHSENGSGPPPIDGVRRLYVTARGVRFHVTEAGAGVPVLALHGWPQHHYLYRDLLRHPPTGLRIIAPDLPGYGWSGPAPHRWRKQDVADDVLALIYALELDRVVLVGHDWGGWIGQEMLLAAPERFHAMLMLSIAHLWQTRTSMIRYSPRQLRNIPMVSMFGMPLQRRTNYVARLMTSFLYRKDALSADDLAWFADRMREPTRARAGTDTFRTLVLREIPRMALRGEKRRATLPIRALLGINDPGLHSGQASTRTARADNYQLELIDDRGHFTVDEKPDVVRSRLIALANEFGPQTGPTTSSDYVGELHGSDSEGLTPFDR